MRTKIIYVPGLGDGYDGIRRMGLNLWNSKNIKTVHVPMRWRDTTETFAEKLTRIKTEIERDPMDRIVLVGESAGGAVVLAAQQDFGDKVSQIVTLCGMNQGVGNVSPTLYRRNPAFRDAMLAADEVVHSLTDADKAKIYILYSSNDFTVRPANTLIPGVRSHDFRMFGHAGTILSVLFWRFRFILKNIIP